MVRVEYLTALFICLKQTHRRSPADGREAKAHAGTVLVLHMELGPSRRGEGAVFSRRFAATSHI